MMKDNFCRDCKWNKYSFDGDGVRQSGGFYCANEESVNCGCPTFCDDTCDDWEAKDD